MAQAQELKVEAQFPGALAELFTPARYKVFHGGRGKGVSWGFARALLIMGLKKPLRVLCARELQKSIKDSVHKLLCDQIRLLHLESYYIITQSEIRGPGGTLFIFAGIRHNVDAIRSMEGIDICWLEEAHRMTLNSWEVIIPTIRKDGSEIWVSFNPDLASDETYKRFIITPPTNAVAIIRKMSWRDNPWFPDVLRQELLDLKARDEDQYLHVWEGHCKQTLEGAVYAKELREATATNHITEVPYDRIRPIDLFLDIGRRDLTAIIFGQQVGFEQHFIDYYENRGEALDHYLRVIERKNYTIGTIWLPHDAKAKTIGTKKSVYEIFKEHHDQVKIVPKLSIVDGINAARMMFPTSYFDLRRCADLVDRLRHYAYKITDGRYSEEPLHDDNSNAADAFRYAAIAMKEPRKRKLDLSKLGIRQAAADAFERGAGWLR